MMKPFTPLTFKKVLRGCYAPTFSTEITSTDADSLQNGKNNLVYDVQENHFK